MRTVHTLKKTHGSTCPKHVLCVDSILALQAGKRGENPPYFTCGTVHTVSVDTDRSFSPVRQWVPTGPQKWLEMLARRCRPGSSHWLIGRGIYQQLTAIGFFAQVDGVTWATTAPPEGSTGHKRRKSWSGFVVVEDKVTIIVVRRVGGGVLHVVDTSNYGVDFADRWEADSEANSQLIASWWQEWTGWIKRANAGSVKYTIGAQALACFKGRHLNDAICVHTHEQALALEGQALYGGRCEAFKLGKLPGWVYHLDARSLYGWCAANARIPVQLVSYRADGEASFLVGLDGCVADVTIETEDPAVPYRLPDQELTVWPVGRFRTTLCAPELSLVMDRVREVHAAAVYRVEPALADFAKECWLWRERERQYGHPVVAGQLKLFSQVLYGKFAQRYRGWRYSPGEEPPAPWSLWWEMDREKKTPVAWRSIAGRVERHVDGGFVDGAIPIISAWISSLARVRLWQLMQWAGRDNVYYCDTDSLFVSEAGFCCLNNPAGAIGPDLGQLRIEGKYNDVEIRGWKHYYAGGKLVCAGFDKRSRAGWATPEGPPKIEPVSAACRERRPPLPLAAPLNGAVVSQYRHGRVLAGGRVVPFVMGE